MSDRLYIRGFPSTYTASDLKLKFNNYGPVKKSYIVSKESILYGIIKYYNPDHMQKAIENLNNEVEDSITWYVAICDTKNIRKYKNFTEFMEKKKKNLPKTLFIKDFPISCTEEQLKGLFEKHGSIESVRINGKKAFITFDEASAADNANKEEKKLIINGSRVYVTKLVKINNLSYLIDKKKSQKKANNKEKKELVNLNNEASEKNIRFDDESQSDPKEPSEKADSSNNDPQEDPNLLPEALPQPGIFRYCTLL
jgi:RNA recognition motif-containing protein